MSATTLSSSTSATWLPKADASSRECVHCGTHFRPQQKDDKFCCAGCSFVHDMITQEGLDQFYELKGNTTTRPIQNLAFEQADYTWLEQAVDTVESSGAGAATLETGLDGASCAACVWLIEHVFQQQPGALQILIDPIHGRVEITWDRGRFDALAFAQALPQFGYKLCPLDEAARNEKGRDPLIAKLGLCAAFAMNGMAFTLPGYLGMPADFMFAKLFQLITALSATLAMAVGGTYFIRRAWQALQQGVLHVDVPIALGLTLAYIGSLGGWLLGVEGMLYFDFVAIFVFLMLGGRWLQEQAMRRNQRQLFQDEVVPAEVESTEGSLPIGQLDRGQPYTIKPNQIVPVASRILSPSALLGMEWIQGETETEARSQGAVAPSGAVYHGHEPLELEARETWAESLLFRLTKNQRRSREHPFLQQVLRVYLWVVLVIGVIGGVSWAWASEEVAAGLQVTLSIFVISCPCALGVAIPLADEYAAAAARRMGVFAQELSFWSRLRRVRKLLFDKTGTLTLETPALIETDALAGLSSEEVSALFTMTSASSHPVSRSLTENIVQMHGKVETMPATIKEMPGEGLRFTDIEQRCWTLTKPSQSHSDAEFAKDGRLLAAFSFREALRLGAAEELHQLEASGFQSHILSGDRVEKVALMARELRLPQERCQGRMTPEEKAERVREIDQGDTLYIGDGANDSLAFDCAYATATPAYDCNLLTDKADCYFVSRSLTFLIPLIRIAGQRHWVIRSVFTFAVLYNAGAIAICLAGLMNPLLAAILMPISSVVTTAMVAVGFRK